MSGGGVEFRSERVGIRVEGKALMFFDLDTLQLLRTRPNPIPPEQPRFLRGVRSAGPPATPVERAARRATPGLEHPDHHGRRAQKVALGRAHQHQTVTVHVAETTLAIEIEGETRVVRRTTTQPVSALRASGHGPLPQFPSRSVKHQVTHIRQA